VEDPASPARAARGTVGEAPAAVDSAEGFVPLTVEEARALMTEALTGIDRDALLAERAEAEAQLRAAEATLGNTPSVTNGRGGAEQEPGKSAQNHQEVDGEHADAEASLDVAELRRAATSARAADDVLARAASEAAERPLPNETLQGSSADRLGTAESAFARALELQEELPAAWRRLVGALISATGMAIVIGALGWNTYWLLVPIALTAIMTVDLRVAGKAAREASAEAVRELGSVGVAGADGLDRVRRERARIEEAESRLAAARVSRDAAYARFDELAPGRRPSEVEEIIAEYEAEVAARAAAEPAALCAKIADAAVEGRRELEARQKDSEPKDIEGEAGEPSETPVPEPEPTVRGDWWFAPEASPVVPPESAPAPGPAPPVTPAEAAPAPPPPPPAPVRALAERLSAEGREALARIEAQLAALDRVELAKRSLEWHEANSSAGQPEDLSSAAEQPPASG